MTGGQAPSLLEQRYRRLLRLLPRPYRAIREEEMVDVFLESRLAMDPDNADITAVYGRPDGREVASVVGLALRLRWGGDDAPTRYRVRTLATQWLALVGLLVNTVVTLNLVVWQLVSDPELWIQQFSVDSLDVVLAAVGALLWVPAFLCAVFGRPRWSQLLVVGAMIPQVVDLWRFPSSATGWAFLIVSGALIVALGAFRRDTQRVTAHAWLIAALLGSAAIQLVWVVPVRVLWWLTLVYDTVGWWFIALAVGTAFVAALGRRAEPHVRAAMLSSLAWGAAAVALVRIASIVEASRWLDPTAADETLSQYGNMTQLVVTVVICIGAAAFATVTTHRLPAVKYGVAQTSQELAGSNPRLPQNLGDRPGLAPGIDHRR